MVKPEESGTTPEFMAAISRQIRNLRKGANLTVEQLAINAGISRRMLTHIEKGDANPSLVTVDKIARALGVDFATLLSEPQPEAILVHPKGTATGVWSTPSGSKAALQVASPIPAAELWDWLLVPGDRYDAKPDAHGSFELFYVLEGVLTLEVEDVSAVEIEAGASARLASDRHYSYVNNGKKPVHFIRVVRLA